MADNRPTGHGYCRSCGAPVIWARTTSGKRMPVDPKPAPEGNVRLEYTEDLEGRGDWFASVVGAGLIAEGFARTSHFATCPFASQHRKRG